MKRYILIAFTALLILASAGVTYAKYVAYRFDEIEECGGGAGWVVISENSDGAASVDILCDGGNN